MKIHFLTKLSLFLILLLSPLLDVKAQDFSDLDVSPMDIVEFQESTGSVPLLKIIYSRPQKSEREIFGALVPYGELWRTGANENTEIIFLKESKIDGKVIKPGAYSLYSIPNKESWTIVINSQLYKPGTYHYDKTNDVLRFEVPVTKSDDVIEAFSIDMQRNEDGIIVFLGWDKTIVKFQVHLHKENH